VNLPELHLLRPAWLLALIPLAFALWRLWHSHTGTVAWRGVVDAHLLPHLLVGEDGRAHWLPLAALALGGLIATLALAGPVWERLPQPAYQQRAERVIVLDISPTMNATDLPPSRLAHARYEILDLLRRFQEGQTALIAYGAEPFVVAPLTADAKTIAAQVPSLSTELLPVEGPKRTDLALEEAGRLLSQGGSVHGQVILLTDALKQPAAALDAARALHRQGFRLSVLGMGSAAGAPVPMPGGGFMQDSNGAILMPKLDSAALQSLAASGGGRYVTARMDDRDIEALVRDTPRVPQRTPSEPATVADQWREEGPWLLLALLPLAAAAFRRGWLSPLLLLVLTMPAPPADAYSWSDLWLRPDQQAAELLQQGQAQDAAQTFQRPDWRAAAAYQAGDYRQALDALDGMEATGAWYNRGNTLARLGDYEKAIAAYDRALAENPEDADARHNRDLVRRLLEQQRQQPSQADQSGSPQDSNAQGGASQQQNQAQAGQGNRSGQTGNQDSSPTPSDAQSSNEAGQAGEQAESDGQDNAAKVPENASAETGAKDSEADDAPQQAAEKSGQSAAKQRDEAATSPAQGGQTGPGTNTEPAPAQQTAEQPGTAARHSGEAAASDTRTAQGSAEPGAADLLGNPDRQASRTQAASAAPVAPMTEEQQAMEHQLNRVPDDPAGLLRQRFLLQHLRRSGQL